MSSHFSEPSPESFSLLLQQLTGVASVHMCYECYLVEFNYVVLCLRDCHGFSACEAGEREGKAGEGGRVVFERFNYFLNDITYIFFITQLQVYCNGSKNCLNNTFIPSFLPLSWNFRYT